MSRNSGVKLRSGIADTQSNKPCRKCGVMMDDEGTHYICLACGYRMERIGRPAQTDNSAWNKQVADLDSQRMISARQAQHEQLLSGFGPVRVLLFLAIFGLSAAGPLQNVMHFVEGTTPGPLALPSMIFLAVVVFTGLWAAFGQPGEQRMLQRNVLGLLAVASLAGLLMARSVNSILAAQYGALNNFTSAQEGVAGGIASVPAFWQAPLLLGGLFLCLAALAFICHREASEQMY